jgi:hypothetical protein
LQVSLARLANGICSLTAHSGRMSTLLLYCTCCRGGQNRGVQRRQQQMRSQMMSASDRSVQIKRQCQPDSAAAVMTAAASEELQQTYTATTPWHCHTRRAAAANICAASFMCHIVANADFRCRSITCCCCCRRLLQQCRTRRAAAAASYSPRHTQPWLPIQAAAAAACAVHESRLTYRCCCFVQLCVPPSRPLLLPLLQCKSAPD